MAESFLKEAKGTFYYGAKTVLQPKRWYAYDVSLPLAKLYYVTNGEVVIRDRERELHVKQGEMVLIPPNTRHSFFLPNEEPAEKYWLHFDLSSGGENSFAYICESVKIHVDEPKYVERLFKTLLSHADSPSPAAEMEVVGSLMLLAAYFLNRANFAPIENHNDEIDAAIQSAEHAENGLTLSDFAATAHLNANHFIRKFKERTGLTPMRYVTALRIERAKSLLETTDLSVSKIMTEAGYADAAYFSKIFKANTGYSPRAFRNIYGNKNEQPKAKP